LDDQQQVRQEKEKQTKDKKETRFINDIKEEDDEYTP